MKVFLLLLLAWFLIWATTKLADAAADELAEVGHSISRMMKAKCPVLVTPVSQLVARGIRRLFR